MEVISSPKRQTSFKLLGITTQKTALFIVTAVRTSNRTIIRHVSFDGTKQRFKDGILPKEPHQIALQKEEP
jgi:hypothetical protein